MTTATTTLDRTDRRVVDLTRDEQAYDTLLLALMQVRPGASLVNVARRNLDRACR